MSYDDDDDGFECVVLSEWVVLVYKFSSVVVSKIEILLSEIRTGDFSVQI